MTRLPITAIGLLLVLGACGQREVPPSARTAPNPAPATQSEIEAAPVAASFARVLEFQGVTFSVTSPNESVSNIVVVSTQGLESDNSAWRQEVDGIVTGAEAADLDADGSPELYVYVGSRADDAMGSVVAYVANHRKSLSMANMQPLSDTPDAAAGYRGHDEFAVLEGVLGRRFPIHDAAGKPTGRIRQLQYVLAPGEAGWLLRVDKMLEF